MLLRLDKLMASYFEKKQLIALFEHEISEKLLYNAKIDNACGLISVSISSKSGLLVFSVIVLTKIFNKVAPENT